MMQRDTECAFIDATHSTHFKTANDWVKQATVYVISRTLQFFKCCNVRLPSRICNAGLLGRNEALLHRARQLEDARQPGRCVQYYHTIWGALCKDYSNHLGGSIFPLTRPPLSPHPLSHLLYLSLTFCFHFLAVRFLALLSYAFFMYCPYYVSSVLCVFSFLTFIPLPLVSITSSLSNLFIVFLSFACVSSLPLSLPLCFVSFAMLFPFLGSHFLFSIWSPFPASPLLSILLLSLLFPSHALHSFLWLVALTYFFFPLN